MKINTSLLALLLLAVQNIAAGLLVEVSRKSPEHSKYSASTVVLMGEFVKLGISIVMLFIGGDSVKRVMATFRSTPLVDSLKLAVPALIYTIQNNLIFLSLSHIPSATFQVFSQLKVLTTAVFSVTMLRRKLYRLQWIGLVVLVCGVSLAHLPCGGISETVLPPARGTISDDQAETVAVTKTRSPSLGVLAVCLLTLLSGFSGVYQERIVKRGTQFPIAYFNVQLCAYSIVTNLLSVASQHGSHVLEHGLWHGYTYLTWLIIFVQSVGGILVSVVIRYASNLAKSYVVSVAIFATGIFSYLFLDFEITAQFMLGAVLVTCSVLLYNEPDSWRRDPYTATSSQERVTAMV